MLAFTASLLDVSMKMNTENMEIKPASLLVVQGTQRIAFEW